MGLLLWIIFGVFACWLASVVLGRRQPEEGAFGPIVIGAAGAVAAGHFLNRFGPPDPMTILRLSMLFVGAVGLFVIASLSAGGRLR